MLLSVAEVTEPRFTKDIDVNLRLGPGSVDKFVAAATAVGAELRSETGIGWKNC